MHIFVNQNGRRNEMAKLQFIEQLKSMDIPARAKADLLLLWHKARTVAEGIVRFIQRHHRFAQSMILGAIIAYAVAHVPWIGGLLAACALVTSAAIGVLHELRESIAELFEPLPVMA
jgi:hypothetical protein